MMELLGAFDKLKDSVGIVLAIGIFVTMGLVRLYFMERADRRAAWVAYNAMMKDSLDVMGKVNTALVVLTTVVQSFKTQQQQIPVLEPRQPRRRAVHVGDDEPEDKTGGQAR